MISGWLDNLLPASRSGYLTASFLVIITSVIAPYLVVLNVLPSGAEYLAVSGMAAQVGFIRRLETLWRMKRRWRFWYASILAFLAFDFMTSHIMSQGPGAPLNPLGVRSQLMIGGFLLFQIFLLPVSFSFIFYKPPLP